MKVSEILNFLDQEGIPYQFWGNSDLELQGFSSLYHYREGTFTWIKSEKNIPDHMDVSKLTLVFAEPDVFAEPSTNIICTNQSRRAFFSTIEQFYPQEEDYPAIGQFTYIGPKVKLGKNVRVGHNCTLDGDIVIGDNTVIWNNVTIINRVRIGSDCEIQSGAIIGHASLGYTETEDHKKIFIKHYGGVTIGDHVYIAKGVNIDRGTIDDTVIGSWVAVDSQARIGHNCQIGPYSTLALGCTLGGSTHIGECCYVSHMTSKEQISIGSHAKVGIGSVVIKNVAEQQTVVGYPARPFLPK